MRFFTSFVTCAHWKQGGHVALGESTQELSAEGVGILGPKDAEVGGEELPTTLPVLVQFLLQASLLV